MIRVFIVAASPLVRADLQSMFGKRGVEVVGNASNIELLADQWLDLEADILLIETSGEHLEHVIDSLLRSQLGSEAAIVILSERSDPRWIVEGLRAGVRAVLPRNLSPDRLVAGFEAVAVGLIVLHPAEIDAMFAAAEPESTPLEDLAEPLTRRENEVLQMLASGLSNKEIAARLAISEHTAKFHVASILGKLGAGSRTEAVSLGIRRGLVLL